MVWPESLSLLIVGFLGVIVPALDLAARRKLNREELEFRKRQSEEEKNERLRREGFMERETNRLGRVSADLGGMIATQLKTDPSWAVAVLERAKLRFGGQTQFAERVDHFREEKQHIAHSFVPSLLAANGFGSMSAPIFVQRPSSVTFAWALIYSAPAALRANNKSALHALLLRC